MKCHFVVLNYLKNRGKKMEEKEYWYDNEAIVGVLLFMFFPLGLYAIYKTSKIKIKASKVLYSFLGFISMLMTIIYILRL